jgi:protein TonB
MLARRRGYAGVVMLSVEVLADGRVGRLEIKKTSGYDLLDISALEAVRVWKFSPAKNMGTPVPMWVDVPVRFELN